MRESDVERQWRGGKRRTRGTKERLKEVKRHEEALRGKSRRRDALGGGMT